MSDESTVEDQHEPTKEGRTFKGVCSCCAEAIYSGYDHKGRCPYAS